MKAKLTESSPTSGATESGGGVRAHPRPPQRLSRHGTTHDHRACTRAKPGSGGSRSQGVGASADGCLQLSVYVKDQHSADHGKSPPAGTSRAANRPRPYPA